jgi:hypothetical protein
VANSTEQLVRDNLLAVFNERDKEKRLAAIARTYAPDVRWTDAEGVVHGRDALEAKCVGLQSGLADLQFEPVGSVHEIPGFAYLAWQLVDAADGQVQMTGFDTMLINQGSHHRFVDGADSG